jgi:glycosyltransferase involved in cell wall biosynthesis
VSGVPAAPPDQRLTVLVVTAQFPYPPRSGFAMRVYQLVRGLARRHDVTLLSYVELDTQPQVEELRRTCKVEVVEWRSRSRPAKRLAQLLSLATPAPYVSRELYSAEMQRAIDALCANQRFDVIQLESSLLCAFTLPSGPRLILDEHNLESEVHSRSGELERSRVRRAFGAVESARLRRFEQRWWRRADGIVVTSEREEPLVAARAPGTPIAAVPNGVDLERFRPDPSSPQPDTVIFNGRLDYRPNLDAANWLVDDIWPRVLRLRPQARLAIVGRGDARDLERLTRPSVEVTGEVPEVQPHLASAAVVVVPIRMGGGTRLKVVEGLAMGKAMVSTRLGSEGIAVEDGTHLLVADDPEDFARAVAALLIDRDRAAMLGMNGRSLMEGSYSWDIADIRLAALYARVMSRPAA